MDTLSWTRLERNGDHVAAGALGHYLIEKHEEPTEFCTYVRLNGGKKWKEIAQASSLENAKHHAEQYDSYRSFVAAAG